MTLGDEKISAPLSSFGSTVGGFKGAQLDFDLCSLDGLNPRQEEQGAEG